MAIFIRAEQTINARPTVQTVPRPSLPPSYASTIYPRPRCLYPQLPGPIAMPKVHDFLGPLRDVQSKAEDIVSKMDAAVFNRLGVFIGGDVEIWKAPFEITMREAIKEHRSNALAQLQLHFRHVQTVQAAARVDEGYAGLVKRLTELNLELQKLFDVFQRCLPLFADHDPRRTFLLEEMSRIRSNVAAIAEGEAELQDEFPAVKRALQFLVLPEARFEAFVDPLRQQPDLVDSPLLDTKLVRLTQMWRSRHECLEEIQTILVDTAGKWQDRPVALTEQRKVLREVQKLHRKLRSQADKQDKLLNDIEEFRAWAVETPIFLTDDDLGMIEVSHLLSVLEGYEDIAETSGVFAMLDFLLEKVGTFAVEIEAEAGI